MVYQMLVPAYTVMFVFFLVNIMAGSFLRERTLGTMRRLQLAPISPAALLVGKMAPFFVISLIQSAVLFLTGRFLYGMSWGPRPGLLIPVIVCTSAAATGLGLLVATFVRSDSQVSVYSNFLVITMAGISGCFMPRVWLPPLMQKVSLGTPHAWALIAYDRILNTPHPDVALVAQCCVALAGFAVAFFLLGCWRFRRVE
jgi:ABC-2 type transport system permease protein